MKGARGARHDYYSRDRSLFKGIFPLLRPGAPRAKSPLVCTEDSPMTWGPGPTRHIGGPKAQRRQTTTQGACNRPVVMRPFTFGATSGREDELPHKERATAPRLGASSFFAKNQRSRRRTATQEANNRPTVVRSLNFATIDGPTCGPRPTCHATGATGYWVRKNRTAGCANDASPRGRRRRLKR
jgi:hypothetical protein